jgi:DNA helicase II / ATP-dependent DNA helicase PcrA
MSGNPLLPEISGEDVTWACHVLKLPHTAFSGEDGNDPRLDVIRSLDSLDVEACPGSGKTTLVVAKLAILARHWAERRRGICVLSHTNVARRELETRLGNTPEGKRLLSYPHFVGTLHGFVNEFLALPWLRSKPYPIRVIDDDICLQRRWHKLRWITRSALEKNGHDEQILRLAGTDFSLGDVRWGKGGTLGTETETWQELQRACRESCEEGYFCYGEMFLWAAELLDRAPQMREALRKRFPLLFIDEVQDTSEQQSALLFRLFMDGGSLVIRQRFGDSNQAIYQYSSQTEGALTDPFPDPNLKRTIPNSHRFGQQIANLAAPLGVTPQALVGLGPSRRNISAETDNRHAVFLFDDQTIGHVMPSYAAYLLELFSEHELRDGTFTAVGATHRPGEDDKVPRYVAHYWSEYDHKMTSLEPRPETFLLYVAAGQALARSSGEAHHVVEKVADGVLRLAVILNPTADLSARKRRHRYVLELLASHAGADKNYIGIVSALTADGPGNAVLTNWRSEWAPRVKAIAEILSGAPVDSAEATAFLSDHADIGGRTQPSSTAQHDNVFPFPPQSPKVEIRVGSIHSVKGETHTATLILDTYYRKHHLETLKPWLLGKKSGGGSENNTLLSRLRQHYVAITRPSHLVCLAMRESCLTTADIAALKNRGWRVARVNAGVPEWL